MFINHLVETDLKIVPAVIHPGFCIRHQFKGIQGKLIKSVIDTPLHQPGRLLVSLADSVRVLVFVSPVTVPAARGVILIALRVKSHFLLLDPGKFLPQPGILLLHLCLVLIPGHLDSVLTAVFIHMDLFHLIHNLQEFLPALLRNFSGKTVKSSL